MSEWFRTSDEVESSKLSRILELAQETKVSCLQTLSHASLTTFLLRRLQFSSMKDLVHLQLILLLWLIKENI